MRRLWTTKRVLDRRAGLSALLAVAFVLSDTSHRVASGATEAAQPRVERDLAAEQCDRFWRLATLSTTSVGAVLRRPSTGDTEPLRTALSGRQASDAIAKAWKRRFGRAPEREALAILTAHWAHETNQGASMFNYNFGGIKGAGPNGASVARRAREGHGLDVRGGNHRFRAYATAAEGARDYLELLAKRYRPALEAAERGDTAGFVDSLWAGGYFTGDQQVYLRQVALLARLALDRGFGALGTHAKRAGSPVNRQQTV
jgi:hypothetical protein